MNILEEIIKALNTSVIATGYFVNPYGLAEVVEKEEVKFPALYIGNDELIHLDKMEDGISYFRVASPETKIYEPGVSPRNRLVTKTHNLRFVGIAQRSKEGDNPYSGIVMSERIQDLFNAFEFRNFTKFFNLLSVELSVERVDTDSKRVITEEYESCKELLDFKLAAFAIEFSLVIRGLEKCFAETTTPEVSEETGNYLITQTGGKILQDNGGGILIE